MRSVDLNTLPRTGKLINWRNSIGYKFNFIYDDIKGKMEIVGYNNRKIYLRYKGKEFDKGISTGNLQKAHIGYFLNKFTKEFKFEINYKWKTLSVVNREYRTYNRHDGSKVNHKYYKYKCKTCSYEGWMLEGNITKSYGCPCCSNQIAVLGINTIWDTDRNWIEKYGISEEDAKKYTRGSNQIVIVTCPHCGKKKKIKISRMYECNSIACSCGDRISYPEKIMCNILEQLNVDYKWQLTTTVFNWCGRKMYDFYLPNYNMIIETHGVQHFIQSSRGRSLEEEQKNDNYKKELALNNGIEHYIEINCQESNLEFIKQNILNSELNNMFNLLKIDWEECEKFALNNLVKEVCDYWNNKEEWETTSDIVERFKLSRDTIISYLKKGARLQWCTYNPKEEMAKCGKRSGKASGIPVNIYKNGKLLGTYESAHELERRSLDDFGVKLIDGRISTVCTGKYKQYKGFTFKFTKDAE